MGWDVVQNWMLTGHFEWRVPLRGVVHTWQHKGGKPPMDWWGIQYYSRYTSSSTLHLARSDMYLLSPLLAVCIATVDFGTPEIISRTTFFLAVQQQTKAVA